MNDKQIVDILRESWSPEPPEGLRERVLRGSRTELLHRRARSARPWFTWRVAVAGLGIAIVLATNISDHIMQSRVAEIANPGPASASPMVAQGPVTLGQWRRNMDQFLSSGGSLNFDRKGLKGVDTP